MITVKGKNLKLARIKSGLLQREFALEIGITSNTYACIETGRRSPSPRVARSICSKFGVGFDDLFTIRKENEAS